MLEHIDGVIGEKIVQWPAEVPRNFDANGAPCTERGQSADVALHVVYVLRPTIDFIELNL